MPKSADFIFNPALAPVLWVGPFAPDMRALYAKLAQEATLQVVECASTTDALAVMRGLPHCLVVLHAGGAGETDPDLGPQLSLLKAIPLSARGSVRVIVTTAADFGETHERLAIAGAAEVIRLPISLKAMLFKVDRHLKALPAPTAPSATGRETAPTPRPVAAAPTLSGVRLGEKNEFPSPEQHAFAFSGGGARRVDDRWQVRLRGPRPEWGRWVQDSSVPDRWRWVDAAGAADGEWVFVGAKPEPRGEFWYFTGARISLGLFERGALLGYKLCQNPKGTLVVSPDSQPALAALARGELGKSRAATERVAARRANADPGTNEEPIVVSGPESVLPAAPRLVPRPGGGPVPTQAAETAPRAEASSAPDPDTGPEPAALASRFSPLALAFLASELAGRRGLDAAAKASRYCAYLGTNCGGSRVELWVRPARGEWACAGTSDSRDGFLGDLARGEGGRFVHEGAPALAVPAEAGVPHARAMLVFHGPEAGSVDAEYAASAVKMASGLLEALAA